MGNNKALEERVNALERSMGTVVNALKELNLGVKELQEKKTKDMVPGQQNDENKEIREIIEAQAVIDKILIANSEAIKRIDTEIKTMAGNMDAKEPLIKEDTVENEKEKEVKGKKICRYNNRGYCKYKIKCRFVHNIEICKNHLDNEICKN